VAARPRPAEPAPRRAGWLALLGFVLLLGFAFLGTRGLWEPDEGRYAESAREMLAGGDFLRPQLELQPHFTKPPLATWCIAGSIALLGRNEWAVRLHLALAYAITALLTAALGVRLWNPRTGLSAGVIYATSLLPFGAAGIVTTDTLLVLWETLALYGFWRGFTAESRAGRFGWPALTGAAFGLAFLTKGPPALLFLPALWIFRRLPGGRRAGAPPVINAAGWLLFALAGLSWFAAVILKTPGLLGYFLNEEVVGRVAGQHHRNREWYGPLVIYGPAFLLGFLPWIAFLPRAWRRAMPAGAGRAGWNALLHRPRTLFLGLLLAVPLLFLVPARSRLPLYVLPLFVPLALAVAGSGGWSGPRRRSGWLALWVVVLLGARVAFALWPDDKDARRLYRALPPSPGEALVVLDQKPHHGLAFYADRTLENGSWETAATPGAMPPPRLYVLPAAELPRLREILARAGLAATDSAQVGRLALLRAPR
jgi:4-amino-4-deoxy-L-arabinose transferase-like glycosyltransferase